VINLDFSAAIAVFIITLLIPVLGMWLFAAKESPKKTSLEERFIWHCAVCTYAYVNTREDAISVCPRCGSYNKK
jgi:hypothetical protein